MDDITLTVLLMTGTAVAIWRKVKIRGETTAIKYTHTRESSDQESEEFDSFGAAAVDAAEKIRRGTDG